MKKTLLAGATVLAGIISVSVALADPLCASSYVFSGSVVACSVGATGLYDITAAGGQGGGSAFSTRTGGLGAKIGGYFNLTAGEVLAIAVGGAGDTGGGGAAGGGGGGSFVVGPGDTILVISGGGGGGTGSDHMGSGGNNTESAVGGFPGGLADNGQGGFAPINAPQGSAAGGGGFFSNGTSSSTATGGQDFANGLNGGGPVAGGFGGGGGGSEAVIGIGGGGGGYTGGSGGDEIFAGGGGGSFDAGISTDPLTLEAAINPGNGYVDIAPVSPSPVSEPSSLALFALGLVGLEVIRRRRRAA